MGGAEIESEAVGWKGSGQCQWRWIRIESSGREVECDADKHAIMRRLEIDGRDLRILDPVLSYPSTILARDKAILLNLEHIRAIITAREVLVFDPSHDNVSPVVEELRRRLNPGAHQEDELMFQDELPFEFRALEVTIEAICIYLHALTSELESKFYPALDMVTSKVSSSNLDRIRKLKNQLTKLTARVQKVTDELEQILDDHNDMMSLCLSRKEAALSPLHGSATANWVQTALSTAGSIKASATSRASVATLHEDENDVGELEMLLEAYFIKFDGTLQKLTALREYVGSTEAFINIQLEHRRNQLLQLELFLSAGTLSLSLLALVTGLFGVNIKYKWNHGHGDMFKWVLIVTSILAGLVYILIIFRARCKGLIGS